MNRRARRSALALAATTTALLFFTGTAGADVAPYDRASTSVSEHPSLTGTADATVSADRSTGALRAEVAASEQLEHVYPSGYVAHGYAYGIARLEDAVRVSSAGTYDVVVRVRGAQSTTATVGETNTDNSFTVESSFRCQTGCVDASAEYQHDFRRTSFGPTATNRSVRGPRVSVGRGQSGYVDVEIEMQSFGSITGPGSTSVRTSGTVYEIALVRVG